MLCQKRSCCVDDFNFSWNLQGNRLCNLIDCLEKKGEVPKGTSRK